jgi:hypothetical protein
MLLLRRISRILRMNSLQRFSAATAKAAAGLEQILDNGKQPAWSIVMWSDVGQAQPDEALAYDALRKAEASAARSGRLRGWPTWNGKPASRLPRASAGESRKGFKWGIMHLSP